MNEIRPGAPEVEIRRRFTREGEDVYEGVKWERRKAQIKGDGGKLVFEQDDVEVPEDWSPLATNIVASKYFRGHVGTPHREYSVKQLVGRVVRTLCEWGRQGKFFADDAQEATFRDELSEILVNQKACFNSPVWFNLGVVEPDGRMVPQQASACFINSVEDTMESIMDLAKTEAMLFKGGSGTGSNLSTIRSSRETLGGGGVASGPVSFMKGFDSFAGVIRSGGKTRRAAKMVILNADHPDILDFVRCKSDEEQKAWALIDSGYDGQFNVPGGAYDSIQYQNANHSVRVTDSFMKASKSGGTWQTRSIKSGDVVETFEASDLLGEIAKSAHICGDPGLQYDTTINRWNPVKNTGRINATNPCAEFIFLDDTACNLASINLLKFADDKGLSIPAPARLADTGRAGFNDVLVDADGTVRRGLLLLSGEDGAASFAFSLILAAHYLAPRGIQIGNDPNDPGLMRLGNVTVPLAREIVTRPSSRG